MRQRIFRHQKRRPDVATDLLVELVDGHVVRLRVGEKDARIVDQHVEPAEAIQRRFDAGARLGFIGNVARIRDRLASIRDNRNGDVVDRIVGQAVDDDPGAFSREFVTDRFADSSSAASHDGDLVLQLSTHRKSPWDW